MKLPSYSLPIVILAVITANSYADSSYVIQRLGVQGREALGAQINEQGHVIFGVIADNTSARIVQYFFDGHSTTDLAAIFDHGAVLNDGGSLVGVRRTSELNDEAFRYTIPALDGPPDAVLLEFQGVGTSITATNNDGAFVGWHGPANTRLAFLSRGPGQFTELGTLGGERSLAQAVNNSGQIVGVAETGATPAELAAGAAAEEAFLYENGQMIGIGTLGGATSVARAINEQGTIVGDSTLQIGNGEFHVFVYDSVGGMRDIGQPGFNSVAHDVNDFGVVVGQQYDPLGIVPPKAFLYDEIMGLRFLDNLLLGAEGWQNFTAATGINNRGQIVGVGIFAGETQIFLATPIPEPSSAALLVLSALFLCGFFSRPRSGNSLSVVARAAGIRFHAGQ
jgi:probable HAF family extracellular repeat protein